MAREEEQVAERDQFRVRCSVTMASMRGRSASIRFTVNLGATRRRSHVWSGGSELMSDGPPNGSRAAASSPTTAAT